MTIGKSNEGRDLVVVFVGSDESIKNLETVPRRIWRSSPIRGRSHRRAGEADHREGQAASIT